METPTLKFPRSGRLVTPLSMGYWHLKKKMHCIISDSSTSNEDEKEETPLKRFPNRREEVAASVEETPRARPRQFVPVSSRRPVVDTQKENEDPLMTDSKSRRSLSQAGDVLTSATEPVDSEESDKKDVLPPIRRRRKAQKFWGGSSSPGSERKKNTASSSSAEDETENLSARSPRQAGDIFTTATKPADSEESDGKDNLPLIRRRRKAQKFWDESSSPKIEGQKNTASSGSAEDETENLSKALLSVRIGSTSPPLSGVDTRTQVRTEIQSDDNDRLSSDDKDKAKSPPLHQFNVQDRPKPPVTEPKNRTRKGIIRKLITPQTAPAKGTRKARVNFKVNLDDDDSDFDELLEKLRNRKHENDVYDESQIDLNNTVCEWEKRNEDDRWFLESLDEDNVSLESCHKDALRYRTSKFDFIKDELATKLYNLYHGSVFQNRFDFKIPINWNVRMLTTAGFCCSWENPDGSKYAKIELSPKVVDRTSRLRDTLLHEMCHAASWFIHGYRDGHGNIFKFWGQRSFQLLGLEVTTYHTYVIETKYIYKCQGCGLEIGRHSKSLDTSRIICKECKGRFELYVNDKRSNKQTPASERKQSAFSKFVQEEYKDIKAKNPHLKHGEVMSALSERWKTMKIRF